MSEEKKENKTTLTTFAYIVVVVLFVISAILIILGALIHGRALISAGMIWSFLTANLFKAFKKLAKKENQKKSDGEDWFFIIKEVFNPWAILFIGLWLIVFVL